MSPEKSPASPLAEVDVTGTHPRLQSTRIKGMDKVKPSSRVWGVALEMEPEDHSEHPKLSVYLQTPAGFEVCMGNCVDPAFRSGFI